MTADIEKRVQQLAHQLTDRRIEEMADTWDRNSERLAVLEAELKHVREAQDRAAAIAKEERAIMQADLVVLAQKVQALTDVLTKASGMKMAFTLFGAGLMLAASQFWQFINWAKPVIILAVLVGLSGPASAHEWYGKRRDPIYSTTTCCGGSDCAPLPAHSIHASPDGSIRVSLTLEEARAINPRRDEPFDEIIPFERLQTSEDGRPHICLMPRKTDARDGFYCIFLPPNG